MDAYIKFPRNYDAMLSDLRKSFEHEIIFKHKLSSLDMLGFNYRTPPPLTMPKWYQRYERYEQNINDKWDGKIPPWVGKKITLAWPENGKGNVHNHREIIHMLTRNHEMLMVLWFEPKHEWRKYRDQAIRQWVTDLENKVISGISMDGSIGNSLHFRLDNRRYIPRYRASGWRGHSLHVFWSERR